MLKKFLIALVLVCAGFSAYATTDIQPNGNLAGGSTAANCTQPVLGTYSGSTNFEAKWRANEVPLRWYNEGERITTVQDAAKTCTYDGTLTIPSTAPSRTGYTFAGWKVIPGLPAGYTELEYIELTGTQYIDTGVTANQTSDVTMDYQSTNDALKWLFGVRDYSNGTGVHKFSLQGISTSSNTFWLQFDDTAPLEYRVDTSFTTPEQRLSRHKIRLSGNKVYLNDNLIYTMTDNYTNFTSEHTLLIGNNYSLNGGVAAAGLIGKIYSFVYYKNGVLAFHGIPAKNSSNVIGMYDTVSGTFFTNAGSGTFTAGPALD